MYYQNKKKILEDIFGTQKIDLKSETISINNQTYPIVNDVIVLTDKENESVDFVSDIQFTFGEEWEKYPAISQEHCQEFYQYFDLVDFASLKNLRICDLGRGNGRWSYFLKNYCKEMILVDFSDAIFVARKNLANADNCIFIK